MSNIVIITTYVFKLKFSFCKLSLRTYLLWSIILSLCFLLKYKLLFSRYVLKVSQSSNVYNFDNFVVYFLKISINKNVYTL